jgi:hypothetical protein
MNQKIDITEVEAVLYSKKIEPSIINSIIKDLTQVIEEIKTDKEKDPKQKWEHVIIIQDKEGILKNHEVAGWVVQQKANEDAALILPRLIEAASTQNSLKKRKKGIIGNFTELFEGLKSKFTKEKDLKIKTKELTRVIITDGNFRVQ